MQTRWSIQRRKFSFSPTISYHPLSGPIVECPGCSRFFHGRCPSGDGNRPCHSLQFVFTDGACSNNGLVGAKGGLGIFFGGDNRYSWSLPVADTPEAPITSQCAELLAAIEGLNQLHSMNIVERCGHPSANHSLSSNGDTVVYPPGSISCHCGRRNHLVIVTDSEYVTKGITEWFPAWRQRGWRTSGGKRPANLHLFSKLDELVANLEQDGIGVGFWHIPREYNRSADALAKRAARA